ncbi:MAG: MATE family efflux transporter [ANME-2 cluster archaeon]|nr:MATE family efflux transporter [ANME-2 cluster archaeon]
MNERNRLMADQSIGRLLLNLSAPATVGMLVHALYNLTDTIFVGRGLGEHSVQGIAGIAIVFPIQMILMAVAMTIGLGGASIISRSLGVRDVQKAERTLGNMVTLVLVLSAFFTLLGSIFIFPLLKIFGATTTIMPYSFDYLSIILYGTVFFSFSMAINNVLRAEGNAKDAMLVMVISGIINIILDPIFIFGFHMGVKGAALATVIAQIIGAIYIMQYFISGRSIMSLKFQNLRLHYDIVTETFAIGISGFVRQASSSFMVVILNHNLGIFGGDIAIAVFGIINRLFMILFMPMFGTIQGMQPIVGFNYGARNFSRVRDSVILSIKVTTTIAVLGFLVLFLFPGQLFSIFTTDQQLIDAGISPMRIIVLAIPLIGYQIVGSAFYQSIGKARPSLILSMARQVIFLIPLVIILPRFFELTGVWVAFPVADTLAFGLTYLMLSKELKLLSHPPI